MTRTSRITLTLGSNGRNTGESRLMWMAAFLATGLGSRVQRERGQNPV